MTYVSNHRPGHRQMISPVPGTRPPVNPKPRRFPRMSDEERTELEREWGE